jgi:glyoxylase-like metal-dependent hydrolase (beta-lactamase superfamily II)
MRRIAPGIYLETKYPGVQLGAVVTDDGLFLIDCPARAEDGRDWLATLADYGKPRYLALLDSHPDRVLGARNFDFPRVAQDWTLETMSNWSDSFKGSARPIGAEVDSLKRITGVKRAVPELAFSEQMVIHLGERQIDLWHRPGPTPGSMWVVFSDAEVVFIGDAVTVGEPPFLGDSDIEAWLDTLDDLRAHRMRSSMLVSSRDGLIKPEHINDMSRFLRKVPWRLERLGEEGAPPEETGALALELIKDFKIPKTRREHVLLRLQVGLERLYGRLYPMET